MVMNNFSAHKCSRVREIVEGRGYELLYPPPFSPDLDPIEQAFSKVEELMCGGSRLAPTKPLSRRSGVALPAITVQDTRGFFEHCGYCAHRAD